MAANRINPFEQHAEKLVLALALAALAGVVLWQFIGGDPTVKLGQRDVSLADAPSIIKAEAEAVQTRITTPREAPAFTPGATASAFQAQLTSGNNAFAQNIQWPASEAWTTGPGEIRTVGGDAGPYAVVSVPAPTRPLSAVSMGAVHPIEIIDAPELAAWLPERQPLDTAWVTVEARFNGQELANRLAADPDGQGPIRALRRHWWDTTTQILGIEVERQQRLPNGSWSEAKVLPQLPGRFSPLQDLAEQGAPSRAYIAEVASLATEAKQSVRRPLPYSTIFGERWLPPSRRVADTGPRADDPQREISRLLSARERSQSRVESLTRQMDQEQNEARRRNLQSQIDRENTNIADTNRQLQALGHREADAPEQPDPAAEFRAELERINSAEQPLLSASDIWLWSHDYTAKRGETYRYRLRVIIPNPFFGQQAALNDEQKPLANQPIIRSEPSAWTEPTTVPPDTLYFITAASVGDGMITAIPSATAELFTFFNGYWRAGRVRLEPGDFVETDIRVPLLPAFDAAAPDAQPPMGEPGRAPGTPPPARPGDFQPPTDVAADQPQQINFGLLHVKQPAMLLDVATAVAIGRGDEEIIAYLRRPEGDIAIRRPSRESADPLYAMARASARLGEAAITPERPAEPSGRPTRPEREPQPDERSPRAPSPGGRGGGG